MLTATQRGTAGEQLFAARITLSSVGELELFKPLTDDDHTDVTAGRRGKVPAAAIQVKTALSLDRKHLAVARMAFPDESRESTLPTSTRSSTSRMPASRRPGLCLAATSTA